MKETRTRWTEEEDKILAEIVTSSIYNKRKAFAEASLKVNHSISGCASRWYSYLSNPESKYYIGCTFDVINRQPKINDTNLCCPVHKPKKSLWKRIKELLTFKR